MVLFLSLGSAFCICEPQVGGGKEHVLQRGCELPHPAMQMRPLGCPPHNPMHHGNYQPMVQMGGDALCAGAEEALDNHCSTGAGGLHFTSH